LSYPLVLPDYKHDFKSTRLPITRGYSRRALSFDGTQYVQVMDHATLRPANLTVCLRHRLLSTLAAQPSAFPCIIDKRAANSGFAIYYVQAANQFTYSFGDGITVAWPVIAIDWDVEKFTHVTFRHDGATGEILINAVSKGTLVKGFASAITNLLIAVLTGFSNHLYGDEDGILFYNRSLSDEEVRYNMLNYHSPVRNGLQMWLAFEEGQGLMAVDLSGTGNNGSLLPVIAPPTWIRTRKHELRVESGG